jgi:DNA-binding transcriptional MocR family regulator
MSLVGSIDDPTPRGIASAIARLITSGDLAPGDRLPTVRELAGELGVSPATVSNAWQSLAGAGLITSRGRSGSFVRSAPREWLPRRYQGLQGTADARLDLSRGIPDPRLLPELGPALAHGAALTDTESYQQKPDVPELHDLMRTTWPAPVESLTITNGALDAIDRALGSLVRFGDRVAIENPTFPPVIDLLDHYGLEAVPVELDSEGMVPERFAAALGSGPSVVFLQPRAQNPTGASMTPARAEHLASILRRTRAAERTVVLEDDHSGAISSSADVSLATWLPDRVLHVRSYSKSHGPDLRVGALGGPRDLVDRIVARRLLGPGWTSRITQTALFTLLTDPAAVAGIDRARAAYAQRQREVARELARGGLRLEVADGINLWLPVADERRAIVHLAAAGIRVAPGAPFQLGEPVPRVRVTVGAARSDFDLLARSLAASAQA